MKSLKNTPLSKIQGCPKNCLTLKIKDMHTVLSQIAIFSDYAILIGSSQHYNSIVIKKARIIDFFLVSA